MKATSQTLNSRDGAHALRSGQMMGQGLGQTARPMSRAGLPAGSRLGAHRCWAASKPVLGYSTHSCGSLAGGWAAWRSHHGRDRTAHPNLGRKQSCQHGSSRQQVVARSASSSMLPLGFDLLTFLTSTVVMVPLFKKFQVSPVLGFLLSGIILHQLGLIRDPKDMEALSELGVLFLLFEMGLELSLDRLKALAKYAFGLGTLQMVLCTAIFSAFALPAGNGLGTHLLEVIAGAPHSLVSIRSVDEAVVIGGALSMSSSAFVLQLLSERGEMPTKVGSATLGILLLQDIAVVPFLVLLPLAVQLQAATGGGSAAALLDPAAAAGASQLAAAAASSPASLVALLLPTALKTCLGLAALLYGGRILLRRVFEVVAQSDNSETFVGLCLLTVAGAAYLTSQLGFSDTMGAFAAGVLLSESSYKTQVEADIRPFRGLLLGLFFVTTGGSIDMNVLQHNWPVIGCILAGLITIKTAVVAALGPQFGLSRSESLRTGFMLSQGGEFAFVLLSLASSLHILPENLNQVLIIVVVLSMALTPGLAQLGKVAGDWVDEQCVKDPAAAALQAQQQANALHAVEEPVVIVGFGPHGQVLATLLDQPLASLPDPRERAYIAFDLDPGRVQAARDAGFNVVYGDGTRAAVLRAAGITRPRAIAVCLTTNKDAAHKAVEALRASYPTVPLYALGADMRDAAELERAGADRCVMSSAQMGIALGQTILSNLGASQSEAAQMGRRIEEAVTSKAHLLAEGQNQASSALDAEARLMLLGPAVTGLVGPGRARSPEKKKKKKSSSSKSGSSMSSEDEAVSTGSAGAAAAAAAAAVAAAADVGIPPEAATAAAAAAQVAVTAPLSASVESATAGAAAFAAISSRANAAEAVATATAAATEVRPVVSDIESDDESATVAGPGTPTVAMARLDPGSDGEGTAEDEVAGIVYVDASRSQQLMSAQQRYVQRAQEQKSKPQGGVGDQQDELQPPPANGGDNDEDSEGRRSYPRLNGKAVPSSSNGSSNGSSSGNGSGEEDVGGRWVHQPTETASEANAVVVTNGVKDKVEAR